MLSINTFHIVQLPRAEKQSLDQKQLIKLLSSQNLDKNVTHKLQLHFIHFMRLYHFILFQKTITIIQSSSEVIDVKNMCKGDKISNS